MMIIVIEMVYQSMLSYDRDNQLQPELATEQPTISEDGSTLTFKLKKGVKFSDGSKLDAGDVYSHLQLWLTQVYWSFLNVC